MVTTRLKREDHKRTKHDSHFSRWKILIGSDDWEDYSAGKEGVARYRVENLPRTSRSGLYELAVYRAGSSSRDNPGRVDSHKVLVVYIGEADNVRTRLQQYGRTGAHLGSSCFGDKGHGCFEDIFSRGYSIVYRWAPMENKLDAQRTEAQLLDTFDYTWNKGSNGVRRHEDILQKLDKGASNPTPLATFWRKLLPFHQKRVGIDIKSCKLLVEENEFSKYPDAESYNILSQVFKFSRSRHKLVLELDGSNENGTIICGVVSTDGTICERPPVEGRKRCTEHKGQKTKGYAVRLSTSEKLQMHRASSEYIAIRNGESDVCEEKFLSIGTAPSLFAGECPEIEHISPICGVTMDDGSLCRRLPILGRKRCGVHKGMRISDSNSELRYQTVPHALFNSYDNDVLDFDQKSSEFSIHIKAETSPRSSVFNEGYDTICEEHIADSKSRSYVLDMNSSSNLCGAPTRNGYPCQRRVNGKGRCWQHLNHGSSTNTEYLNHGGKSSSICGAPTRNGSSCKRTVNGNGRCWQH